MGIRDQYRDDQNKEINCSPVVCIVVVLYGM